MTPMMKTDQLIDRVCKRHGITKELFLSERKYEKAVTARREVAITLYRGRGMGYTAIGRKINRTGPHVKYLVQGAGK